MKLQRCGSTRTRIIHADPARLAYNPHLLLWQVSNRKLTGLQLLGEQPITLMLPANLGCPEEPGSP